MPIPHATQDAVAAAVDEVLMAVHAANVPDHLDREALKVLGAQLGNVCVRAEQERLVRVANVGRHLQRLLAGIDTAEPSDRHAATVRRGLDVLSLLAQDAERQRAGHAAAALDDAVDCFVDQVERTLRGERGARIMRFPQSRTRLAAADAPAPCPIPAGNV